MYRSFIWYGLCPVSFRFFFAFCSLKHIGSLNVLLVVAVFFFNLKLFASSKFSNVGNLRIYFILNVRHGPTSSEHLNRTTYRITKRSMWHFYCIAIYLFDLIMWNVCVWKFCCWIFFLCWWLLFSFVSSCISIHWHIKIKTMNTLKLKLKSQYCRCYTIHKFLFPLSIFFFFFFFCFRCFWFWKLLCKVVCNLCMCLCVVV